MKFEGVVVENHLNWLRNSKQDKRTYPGPNLKAHLTPCTAGTFLTAVKKQRERQIRPDLDAVPAVEIVCLPKYPCSPTDKTPSCEALIEISSKRRALHHAYEQAAKWTKRLLL